MGSVEPITRVDVCPILDQVSDDRDRPRIHSGFVQRRPPLVVLRVNVKPERSQPPDECSGRTIVVTFPRSGERVQPCAIVSASHCDVGIALDENVDSIEIGTAMIINGLPHRCPSRKTRPHALQIGISANGYQCADDVMHGVYSRGVQ